MKLEPLGRASILLTGVPLQSIETPVIENQIANNQSEPTPAKNTVHQSGDPRQPQSVDSTVGVSISAFSSILDTPYI